MQFFKLVFNPNPEQTEHESADRDTLFVVLLLLIMTPIIVYIYTKNALTSLCVNTPRELKWGFSSFVLFALCSTAAQICFIGVTLPVSGHEWQPLFIARPQIALLQSAYIKSKDDFIEYGYTTEKIGFCLFTVWIVHLNGLTVFCKKHLVCFFVNFGGEDNVKIKTNLYEINTEINVKVSRLLEVVKTIVSVYFLLHLIIIIAQYTVFGKVCLVLFFFFSAEILTIFNVLNALLGLCYIKGVLNTVNMIRKYMSTMYSTGSNVSRTHKERGTFHPSRKDPTTDFLNVATRVSRGW